MAHELGHLRLESNSDSPTGLMRADWDLSFSTEQCSKIRARVTLKPTESCAVENSPNFREAARESWKHAASGTQRREAGFIVYNDPLRQPDQVDPNPGDEMELRVPKDALGSAHTHPNHRQADPSPADIQAAKKSSKWIWVISRDGLYSVSPKGDVQHFYKSQDWMKDKQENSSGK